MLGVMTHWVTIEIVCVCVSGSIWRCIWAVGMRSLSVLHTERQRNSFKRNVSAKIWIIKHTNFSNQSDKTVSFVATKLMRLTNGSLFSGSDYKPLIISRIIHVKFIRHWTWRMNKNKTRLHCSNRMTSSKRAAIMERWNTHSLRHLFLSLSVHLLFIHATKSK